MNVKRWAGPAAMLAALTAGAIAATQETVSQRGRKFNPDRLTIAPGTTVRIANDDRVTHHIFVEQPDMKYDSGEQAVGNAVLLRLDREGRFLVRCAIHPTMLLEIEVR